MPRTNKSLLPIFYVYIYLNPLKPGSYNYQEFKFDYEPFYVGEGHNRRMYGHINEAFRSNKKSHKLNVIRKIYRNGFEPIIIKIKENMLNKEALDYEIYVIKTIGRKNKKLGPLTNLTDGGDGYSGKIYSEKELQKISNSNKLFWSKPENKEKHSKRLKEVRQKTPEKFVNQEENRQKTIEKRLEENPNWFKEQSQKAADTMTLLNIHKSRVAKSRKTIKENPEIEIERVKNLKIQCINLKKD